MKTLKILVIFITFSFSVCKTNVTNDVIIEELHEFQGKYDNTIINKESIITSEINILDLDLFDGINLNYNVYENDSMFNYKFIDYNSMPPGYRDLEDPDYEIIIENDEIQINFMGYTGEGKHPMFFWRHVEIKQSTDYSILGKYIGCTSDEIIKVFGLPEKIYNNNISYFNNEYKDYLSLLVIFYIEDNIVTKIEYGEYR